MPNDENTLRVLYSFPHKLGASRICYTAWQQVSGLAATGAKVLVYPGVLHRPVPSGVAVKQTLAAGKLRIPYKLIGMFRACKLHDQIVASRLKKLVGEIDIIHTWPLGAHATLKEAARLGIPTVLERPNAHTRYAYEVVQKECERIGVPLPPDHEHAYNKVVLAREEEEYQLADALLCPSDFVMNSFCDQGFAPSKLIRHIYGYDEKRFFPDAKPREQKRGLTMISVGVCAVRKGLHFALEAWLNSPASKEGTFLIAGDFLPAYREKLSPMLAHPSVKVLGHRHDIPELMRQSDILVLPSIEEGSALVVGEAMGSGCVPVISKASAGICTHMVHGLVHPVADVKTLCNHVTQLHENRDLLAKLRDGSLKEAAHITWQAAGVRLAQAYREAIALKKASPQRLNS